MSKWLSSPKRVKNLEPRTRLLRTDKREDQPQQLNLTVRAGLVEDALELRAGGFGADVVLVGVVPEAQAISEREAEPKFRGSQPEPLPKGFPPQRAAPVGVAQDEQEARRRRPVARGQHK